MCIVSKLYLIVSIENVQIKMEKSYGLIPTVIWGGVAKTFSLNFYQAYIAYGFVIHSGAKQASCWIYQ
jgi:hypothetical protein